MNSVVAAQFWVSQNTYRFTLMVISKKRYLKRCFISVVDHHDLAVAEIYLSRGYSAGGP